MRTHGVLANFTKWLVMKSINVSVVDQPFDVVVYLVPTRPSFTRSCVRRSPLYIIYGGILFPTALPHPITVVMDDRGEASTLVRSPRTPNHLRGAGFTVDACFIYIIASGTSKRNVLSLSK